MLTSMHVQYLIGLFCRNRTPEAVDITIGDMVYDTASESKRDVDITVTTVTRSNPDKSSDAAVAAYEVKAESKPLDVVTVEGLCAKLNDMPKITHKLIVSASGYTKPAIKKAVSHGIVLYEFVPWNSNVNEVFRKLTLSGPPSESFQFRNISFQWVGPPNVAINPKFKRRSSLMRSIRECPFIFDAFGTKHPEYNDVSHFLESVSRNTLVQLSESEEAQSIKSEYETTPDRTSRAGVIDPPLKRICFVEIQDGLFIKINNNLVKIEEVEIHGIAQWSEHNMPSEYYIMKNIGNGEIFSGAAICQLPMSNGILVTAIFNPETTLVEVGHIQLSEKHKNAIRNLKIKSALI